MRTQLELEGIPRKRVSLIAESTDAPKAEESKAMAQSIGSTKVYAIEMTDWFDDTSEPLYNGYYDVRETFDPAGKVTRYFYNRLQGWPDSLAMSAKFQWRGLKAPAPGGYMYDLQPAKVRRAVLLPD